MRESGSPGCPTAAGGCCGRPPPGWRSSTPRWSRPGRTGGHLDEVKVVAAESGRAGGRNYVRLPVSYPVQGALPSYAQAPLAHEVAWGRSHLLSAAELHRLFVTEGGAQSSRRLPPAASWA